MPKIAIFVDTARASGRKFLTGIKKYAAVFAQWEVYIHFPKYLQNQRDICSNNLSGLDGMIIRDSKIPAKLAKAKIPMVINDTGREHIPGACCLHTASDEIGKVAAEYLFDLGFRHFAYCGWANLAWSQKRFQYYAQTLQKLNAASISHFMAKYTIPDRNNITKWLLDLPKPVALFACNDDFAVEVLETCKAIGIRIPEEIAVLGVDNDELICDFAKPPLTSIELNFEKAGFEAAKLLDNVITKGHKFCNIVISPSQVIARQSTDTLAIEDKELRDALVFIRNNFQRNIHVSQIADFSGNSKRNLELKFQKYLRRSVKDELLRLRINNLKSKLIYSNESVHNIASGLAYTDPEHFCRFFKRAVGLTPAQFRNSLRC